MATKKMDLEKFLNDPAHSEDKELLFGAFDAYIKEKTAKLKEENPDEETNFFDVLLGRKK